MQSPFTAVGLFVLLCAAAALGFFIRDRLPEHHRSGESISLVQMAVTLLVNFTAIVLGLLTTSVKSGFDAAYDARGADAAQIVQFDRCLREYGPGADAIRAQMRAYVGAVIASTWPDEPPPAHLDFPDVKALPESGESPILSDLLADVATDIHRLPAPDALAAHVLAECDQDYHDLLKARWKVIEGARGSISPPFYWVLSFWLAALFAAFGLIARPNSTIVTVIALSALSISVAVFVILDLDQPYGGLFGIPSTAMRAALADMLRP